MLSMKINSLFLPELLYLLTFFELCSVTSSTTRGSALGLGGILFVLIN